MNWLDKLVKRTELGFKRQLLIHPEEAIDFYSNDYLGLTKNKSFEKCLLAHLNENPKSLLGSTGARLVSGNTCVKNRVEEAIANIHGYEAALMFPAGYVANLALYSCIAHRHEQVFVDEQVHRSILDGFRLAGVAVIKFKHNDLNHLETLLKKHQGTTWVVIETLYSMEGDEAPLNMMIKLCNQYNAKLLVDEAHAFAVFGLGYVTSMELQGQVFACTITYGKAMGLVGAAILCSNKFKEYLINFAAPFIYSTAMPDYHFTSIELAYTFIKDNPQLQAMLKANIQYFQNHFKFSQDQAVGAIQPFHIKSSARLLEVKNQLALAGILTYAMFPPAVSLDKQCLRICLHATNTIKEMDLLINHLHQYKYE